MTARTRGAGGFLAGALIGTMGGLVGLGGAEFRLPVLVGAFRLAMLEAVISNKAMSLAVVAAALLSRSRAISPATLADHLDIALNLMVGCLAGAWWAAGKAMTLPGRWLNGIVTALLGALAVVMLAEAGFGGYEGSTPLLDAGPLRVAAGTLAGLGIGMVAAFLGVAGGELLIPTFVLLYGLDVKLAGSLSLAVSLPTMLVGFARYSRAAAFAVLVQERSLLIRMGSGSILGAAAGGLMLGGVPSRWLIGLLGAVLLVSAIMMSRRAH